jgi:NAD(P)-dependent dehydrogenase (short-subunit alcohol dehydrogenase family)
MPVLSEFSLSGKVAVLATSGGEEAPLLSQALAKAGASVFVVARRQGMLDAALAGLGKGDHGGIASPLDTHYQMSEVMAAFDDRYEKADILVNDARSFFAMPFTDICLKEWDEIHSRNLRCVFMLCKAFGQRMLQQQYGRIVNLVSVLAERGMINGSAFAASQAALLSLTRSLAVEWGRHNIRVNALGTGWSSADDILPEVQQEELLVRYTPLRRKGHPRDIGPLLVYLCSEACDYSTGQPVYVDGGLNAHP